MKNDRKKTRRDVIGRKKKQKKEKAEGRGKGKWLHPEEPVNSKLSKYLN